MLQPSLLLLLQHTYVGMNQSLQNQEPAVEPSPQRFITVTYRSKLSTIIYQIQAYKYTLQPQRIQLPFLRNAPFTADRIQARALSTDIKHDPSVQVSQSVQANRSKITRASLYGTKLGSKPSAKIVRVGSVCQ